MRNVQILSTGSYVPERVVTNAEVDALMGESTNEWLLANVGIKERRWMSPEQVTSDLIVEASKKALERAGISASELDLIIVSTDTPDYLSPSTSVVVQAKLGADKAGCYDVNSACAGWVTASCCALIRRGTPNTISVSWTRLVPASSPATCSACRTGSSMSTVASSSCRRPHRRSSTLLKCMLPSTA